MKDTLIFYKDWWEAIKALPIEMQADAYNAVCAYAFEGVQPTDTVITALTSIMRNTIDKNKAKYEAICERNRRNGLKGGAPKGNQNAVKTTQNNPKQPNGGENNPKQPDNDNEYDNNIITSSNEDINIIKTVKSQNSLLEEQFEVFRKNYPGRKRGHNTEFEAFKRKHKNWTEIVPLLMPALQRLIEYNNAMQQSGQWTPNYANLSTWLYQARWEEELPTVHPTNNLTEQPKTQTPKSADYYEEDDAFISKNR